LLERLVVAVVDEPATKLAALSSGELDLAGIAPAHTAFVSRQPDLEVLGYPLLFTVSLVFNTRRPPFDTRAARVSVARALDRTEIVDGITFGYGTPATGPLPPELVALVPEVQDSIPGGRDDMNPPLDTLLEFELLTVGSGEAALEQLVQAQLGRRGIRARIRQLELSAYLERVNASTPDFDAAVLGVSGDLMQGHLRPLLATAGRALSEGENPLQVFARDVPVTFLYHARGIQGKRRAITGIRMDLRGELPTVTRWSTP
jgi:ABC-type transport system substrate-binding protein